MEKTYNIFPFFDELEVCTQIGYVAHDYLDNDKVSGNLLKYCLKEDFAQCIIFKLSSSFSRSEYNAHARIAQSHILYDELFEALKEGASPLVLVTPILDGKINFNYSSNISTPLNINEVRQTLGENTEMVDWLIKYSNEQSIDLPALINDDYFTAIRLTFQNELYVSSMKLLLSAIDSLAYIDCGSHDAFKVWLTSYAKNELKQMNITVDELWELRNGLLHMTNLDSRKVKNNKTRRISFCVGNGQDSPVGMVGGVFYFEFNELIDAFSKGANRWLQTYNNDRSKFLKLVERYDATISDTRVGFRSNSIE